MVDRETERDEALQTSLQKLGFDVVPDGIFGAQTENAVKKLQSTFGYDVDGMVGDATKGLIAKQVGSGWNVKTPAKQVDPAKMKKEAAAPAVVKKGK